MLNNEIIVTVGSEAIDLSIRALVEPGMRFQLLNLALYVILYC